MSSLDGRARTFVESFGGDGIVCDEDCKRHISQGEECTEEETVVLLRKPVKQEGGLWQ